MTGSEEGVKIPDYKLSPIIAYWNGKHFPIEFVVYRCPVDGSIGERGSFCPGHDDGPYGRGGHDRQPVRIPWVGEMEELREEADEELARVTRAAVKGPDGYDYHWCPGVGWCPGCPPSAVPKEEA